LSSYRSNFDPEGTHTVLGDIVDILRSRPEQIPSADVVIGGPPCQGFSLLNRDRDGDPRRALWYYFLKVVELCGASAIVMENVPQLLSSPEFMEITRQLKAIGFIHVTSKVLNAADYGVPQFRRRAFIFASRTHLIAPPEPTHVNPDFLRKVRESDLFPTSLSPWRTVRDAISDLPPPVGTEVRADPPPLNLHFGRNPTARSLARYRAVPPGGNRFDLQRNRPDLTPRCWTKKKSGGTDIFGRLWWDRPAVTIRTEFFKPEKGRYLHPEQHRPITHREAARLQSFPDEFVFCGSKLEIARQIGNAVPPLLARAIAESLLQGLKSQTNVGDLQVVERQIDYLAQMSIRRSHA